MTRIYSSVTGAYLGFIFRRRDVWYSENRRAALMRHASEEDAIARLERQAEHRAESLNAAA